MNIVVARTLYIVLSYFLVWVLAYPAIGIASLAIGFVSLTKPSVVFKDIMKSQNLGLFLTVSKIKQFIITGNPME